MMPNGRFGEVYRTTERLHYCTSEEMLRLQWLRLHKFGLSALCQFRQYSISRLRRKSAMTGRMSAS